MKTSVRKSDNSSSNNTVFTAETLGVVLVLFSAFAFICLISGEKIFSIPGRSVSRFLRGTFGYFAYPVTLFFAIRGVMFIVGKKMPGGLKFKALTFILMLLVAALIHAITMSKSSSLDYGNYLSASYSMADAVSMTCSGGGVVAGLYTYFFTAILTNVGAYVVLSVLIALTLYGYYKLFAGPSVKAVKENEAPNGSFTEEVEVKEDRPVENVYAGEQPAPKTVPSAKLYVAESTAFEIKGKKDYKTDDDINFSYAKNGLGIAGVSYSAGYSDELKSKIDYIKTPAKIVPEEPEKLKTSMPYGFSGVTVSEPIATPEKTEEDVPVIPLYEHDGVDEAGYRAENFREKYAEAEEYDQTPSYNEPESSYYPTEEPVAESFTDVDNDVNDEEPEEVQDTLYSDDDVAEQVTEYQAEQVDKTPPEEIITERHKPDFAEPRGRRARDFFSGETQTAVQPEPEPVKEEKTPKEVPPINREYFRPPIDLLPSPVHALDAPAENHEEKMEIIKKTLEEFHIAAEPQSYIHGPAITQYAVKIPAGIVVSKVLGYADNLQMRLAVKDGVRIQAPIPGKDLIGVEVANNNRENVVLRELMESPSARSGKPSELKFAIGKSIVGDCVFDDLAKGVHYLVAGSTGSGKSVCLNVLITSLIMRYSPEELRFILIDPKLIEFSIYEHIPHLLCDEIISDPKRVIATLNWACEEMERRYNLFRQHGGLVDSIESYNEYVANATVAKMPRIVIVVDELADLMSVCKKDLEARIARIAAKARAAGIHLVLATQRPSVDVVTGVIKANLPSRIAFKVLNFTDSQTIMSEAGAEKLLGNGDMLYKNSKMNNFERYQGAFISKMEVYNIVQYIIEHNKAYFDDEFKDYLENATNPKQEEAPAVESGEGGEPSDSNAEIFVKALAFAVTTGKVSISLIQRRFQIGYIRAAGLIDKMEQSGYIAPSEGSKSRNVFLTREQFEEKFGPLSEA